MSDFDDGNGQVECVPVYYKTDGKAYPFNLHDDLIRQMPYLKKKFLRYDAFAGKGIEDIFTPEELEKASVLTVVQTQTCAFYNNGNGRFKMQPLSIRAQFAPVYSILATDLNNDGMTDLFLGGNFYGLKPEVGRYDASYGVTLLGNLKHEFNFTAPAKSGLFLLGEVRDVAQINTKTGKAILVARNNDACNYLKRISLIKSC